MWSILHLLKDLKDIGATTSTLTKILQYLRPRTGTVTGILGIFDMIFAHFFTDPKWPSPKHDKF